MPDQTNGCLPCSKSNNSILLNPYRQTFGEWLRGFSGNFFQIYMWKMILSCDSIYIIIWIPQNRQISFSVFFCFKTDHVLIFCNAPLSESDRKKSSKSYYMSKSPFTCFLGNFILLPIHVPYDTAIYFSGLRVKVHIFHIFSLHKHCIYALYVADWYL